MLNLTPLLSSLSPVTAYQDRDDAAEQQDQPPDKF